LSPRPLQLKEITENDEDSFITGPGWGSTFSVNNFRAIVIEIILLELMNLLILIANV
jgi:hypothetical protein